MIIVRCANCQCFMRCDHRRTSYVPKPLASTTTEHGEMKITVYMLPCPCHDDHAQKRAEEPDE